MLGEMFRYIEISQRGIAMRHTATFIVGLFLFVSAVYSQPYPGKYDAVVLPMNRVAENHEAMYNDVPVPGAAEDIRPLSERYQDITRDMDDAGQRHFDNSLNYVPISDQE